MKKTFGISLLLFLSTFVAYSQSDKGINFELGLTWRQTQAKAKAENKYIFVDCFATWCAPCKAMDKEVYTTQIVGDALNKQFISIKVQMDSTTQDNEQTRAWYKDAKAIMSQYQVTAFPTYLFVTPDGKLVHKGLGFKPEKDFIQLVNDALTPDKQYYTQLAKFNNGQMNSNQMPALAIWAKNMQEEPQAREIAKFYEKNYLLKLPADSIYTPKNIGFISQYIASTKDPDFQIFYQENAKRTDSVMGKNFAARRSISVIIKSEVIPEISEKMTQLFWDALTAKYEKKYGQLGKIAVLQQRLVLYLTAKDWPQFGQAFKLYYENVGDLNVYSINDIGFKVFQYIDDPEILQLTLDKLAPYKEEDAETRDTYANLLYKLKRTDEAIAWEQKAVQFNEDAAKKRNRKSDPVFKQTLEKMQKGIPTWVVKQ